MTKSFPSIALIILNWNGKKDTLACLQSVLEIDYPNFAVIVVDNASSDGSQAEIRSCLPQITLIENPKNLGFAEGNNIGIVEAMKRGADLVFLLNNDTVVDPLILQRFVEMFEKEPKAGILGATLFLFDQREKLDHLGGFWNGKKGKFDFVGLRANQEEVFPQELDYVCGAGLIVKRSVLETVGMFDPRFFLIWEESDLCVRAKRAGFAVLTCPGANVWHKVSASFTGGKPHTTYYWWRNRLLWIEKNVLPEKNARLPSGSSSQKLLT